MRINKQARRDAKDLFMACLVNGVLAPERVRDAVTAVIRLKPRGYAAVLDHFKHLVALDLARRTARIESATALTPDVRQGIEADLTRTYGAGLYLAFAENPALIGGLRVQVGSDVYDGSVQGRLAALAGSF
jgi:F-type H+-transporting ATPase subunit delta